MKFAILVTAVTAVAASPAFAAGGCSTAPQSQWQPQSTLESRLQSEGLKIVQIKVENGCYEVYATNKTGDRMNLAYNAQTLQQLQNAEAGEN